MCAAVCNNVARARLLDLRSPLLPLVVLKKVSNTLKRVFFSGDTLKFLSYQDVALLVRKRVRSFILIYQESGRSVVSPEAFPYLFSIVLKSMFI